MNTVKTDDQIQKDVISELAWDTRVGPTEVGVEVDAHVVTLTGTVPSWAKKLAAADAAHRVAGVLDVANNIVVKVSDGPRPTDTEIAAAVRQALTWDEFVPADRIQSTVENGAVRLQGTVEYLAQREDAARAVGYLAGVVAVDNQITVRRSDVSKTALRAAIQGALERQALRDANRVQLEVEEGRVTLSGTVHSWAERQAVVGATRGTRGVDLVIDELRISP